MYTKIHLMQTCPFVGICRTLCHSNSKVHNDGIYILLYACVAVYDWKVTDFWCFFLFMFYEKILRFFGYFLLIHLSVFDIRSVPETWARRKKPKKILFRLKKIQFVANERLFLSLHWMSGLCLFVCMLFIRCKGFFLFIWKWTVVCFHRTSKNFIRPFSNNYFDWCP